MRRKLFTLAAALSLVVCLATALLWDLSRGVRGVEWQVVRGGVPWRVACLNGEVRVDNSPQREAEARRIEQERQRVEQERLQVKEKRERELERELAPVRQTLAREPYGSPAYERALEDLRQRRQRAEATEVEVEAKTGHTAVVTPEVAHVVRLGPIMGGAAVLPAAWVAGRAYRRWRRSGRRVSAGIRLVAGLFRGRAALVSVPWLVIGIAIVALWVRSDIVIRDGLQYYARSPADRSCTSTALHSVYGEIALSWRKQFSGTPWVYYLHDTTDPSSPGYVPDGPPLGFRYEAKRYDRNPAHRGGTAGRVVPPAAPGFGYYAASFWRRRGFSYYKRSGSPLPFDTPNTWGSYGWAVVPHWFLLALWAVPPLMVLRRRSRAARRAGLRLCPTCGYDLRATPDHCPECGAVPAAKGERA